MYLFNIVTVSVNDPSKKINTLMKELNNIFIDIPSNISSK